MPEIENDLSPYTGRWIALVRGKIIAQGSTADQAAHAARLIRPKETPEILFVPDSHSIFENPILQKILEALPPDQEIYLVGGAVRDFLLQRSTHDLDFVVPKDGIKIAKRVAKALHGAFYPLDELTDVGRVLLQQGEPQPFVFDFASFRKDSLEEDLAARDFSINAIAFDVRKKSFRDVTRGVNDIKEGTIRVCSESSFRDDPVRILRAFRFAAALDFSVHGETKKLIKESIPLLEKPSPERIRDELFRIFDGPNPSAVIQSLDVMGGLVYILPELLALKNIQQPPPHIWDVWMHTFKVVDYLGTLVDVLAVDYDSTKTNDLMTGFLTMKLGRYREQFLRHFVSYSIYDRSFRSILVYSALFHDAGKPEKQSVQNGIITFHGHEKVGSTLAVGRAIKLRLSNAELDRIRAIVMNHMRLMQHISLFEREGKIPTKRAIYRFFKATDSTGVDLCLLALADIRATYGTELTQKMWSAALDIVRIFLESWWERREDVISPPPLVNGKDLMDLLGLRPGPDIGKIIEAIREAQAVGEVSTREDALQLAQSWMAEKNRK